MRKPSDGSKNNYKNKPKFPFFNKNFPIKMDKRKSYSQTTTKTSNTSPFQIADSILKIWDCKSDGKTSSTSNILDQSSSCHFSTCSVKNNFTLPFKQLLLFWVSFTISKDSTKQPMFMYSVENLCLSKE